MTEQRTPVDPEYVCPRFERSPLSLIEEPETCENCAMFDRGFCLRPGEEKQRTGSGTDKEIM